MTNISITRHQQEGTYMNELNIYKKFNYNKLLKISNLYFNTNYKWYNKKNGLCS